MKGPAAGLVAHAGGGVAGRDEAGSPRRGARGPREIRAVKRASPGGCRRGPREPRATRLSWRGAARHGSGVKCGGGAQVRISISHCLLDKCGTN